MKKSFAGWMLVICIIALGVVLLVVLRQSSKSPTPNFSNNIASKKQAEVKKETIDPAVFRLSLNKIFTSQDLSKINKQDLVTIKMTGDIIPARQTNYKIVKSGNFKLPYLKTADWLKAADLTLTNLEAPQIKNCPPTLTGMSFCGDWRNLQGFQYAGIDVASLANNHTYNKGAAAFAEAKANLTAAGIAPVTEEGAIYKTVKGTRFAFLAYNGVENGGFDSDKVKKDIQEAKKNSDVVVLMPHWGKEYVRKPAASGGVAPNDPKVVAKAMIDAGADIILGNHPHWYQGVEIYKNKLIVYAHGNFVFDQDWSEETTKGVVGEYSFYKGKLVNAVFKPIQIASETQPYFLESAKADVILGEMKANSWED